MTQGDWTDDRVERLKRLWTEGLSASSVAQALGGVSRSAVIGKLHRLGVARHGGPGRGAAGRGEPKARICRLAPRPLPKQPASAGGPPPGREEPGLVRDLARLGRGQCRWPIGDPPSSDSSFCGRAATGRGPYCPAHRSLAFVSRPGPRRARPSDGGRP